MSTDISGRCLCGAVAYRCSGEAVAAGHCYCLDCRKTSGTAHGSHLAVHDRDFTVTGDVRFYDSTADSGHVVSRGFCPTCGAALYSKNSGMAGLIFLRASSLDDPEAFQPKISIYTRSAPSWDAPDATLPAFDAMPTRGA